MLQLYVDEGKFHMPLKDPNMLADMAKMAGMTLEEAHHYFQHQHWEMAKWARKAKAYKATHEPFIKDSAKRANAIEIEQCEPAEVSSKENGKVDNGSKKQQLKWSENDSMWLMVYYAVMRHHAKVHNHVFALLNISKHFPSHSPNKDLSDSICY
ncbi:hypothetical protein GGI13_004430 [Coemansia sp. RSA 455]|nr:hypothetical protein GGI13_004430 [Coemansia sp. RSA 455]